MPTQDLEAIVSDPEFATFSADQRALILRDAQARARKKPPLVTPQAADPLPAQTRLNQQAEAKMARRIGTTPPLPTLENVGRAALQGAQDAGNMTVAAAQAGAAMLTEPTTRALDENQRRIAPPVVRAAMASRAARKIGPAPMPAPSLSEVAVGIVDPVLEAAQEARQDPTRFAPWSPGAGEGAGAFAGNVASNVLDPVADVAMLTPIAGAVVAAKVAGVGARAANRVAGDFAGRLGQAVAPAVEAVTPVARRALDEAQALLPASGPAFKRPMPKVNNAVIADGFAQLPTEQLLAQADALQKAAPFRTAAAGAREGSVRVGRQPSDGWTPAQEAANKAIESKIRELLREARQAETDGNLARSQQIATEIQALDDARVVIPKPGQGPVVTIADLQTQRATAQAAGDAATVSRLDRQIRSMRAGRYHNERKYDFMSQESRDKFEGLLEQKAAEIRTGGRDPRTPVPFAEVRRKAADILPLSLEQMARKGLKKGESLTAAEYEAAKNYMQQLVEESVSVERNLNQLRAAPGTQPEAITVESARLMQLEKDISGLLEIVTQSRSQKGRDLAYLKMVAQRGWDTDYWLARANRTAGGAATSQQISEVSQIVVRGQQAEAAGDAAGMRQARIDLAEKMGQLTITPWLEAALAARKAGLLSGLKTIARNNASNSLNLATEELVNVIGAFPDAALGMFTGRRTTFAGEVLGIARGLREARDRGFREALETQIHGMPLDQLAALDIPREINTPNRAFNAYVNHIMRFQGAQDRVYKAYALRRSLDSQARSLALEAARQPGPRPSRAVVGAHARYLADHPTEQMMMEAIADAEFATFQNETALSTAIAGFRQGLKRWDGKTGGNTGAAIGTLMDLFLPFTKTPASIGARVMDFTAGAGAYQAARKRGNRIRAERARHAGSNRSQNQRNQQLPIEWMTAEEQKAISRGLARQAIGNTFIWLGARMYEDGRLTGTDQPDRREENMAAGRTSNAIKVGDEWVPLNPFSPIGNLLTLGATMARDGAPDGWGATQKLATQVLGLMLDQPFTQGAKQFVEVAGDTGGRKFNRFIGSAAGSVVPTIVAETAQFMDPGGQARAIDYGAMTPAMLQSVQARVPFARNALPTAYTGLGDPRDANTGLRAFAAGAGGFARENYDPVVREVLTAGGNVPRVESDVALQRGAAPVPLTLPEQQDLLQATGQAAREAVAAQLTNPTYRTAPIYDQQGLLNTAITRAVANARRRWVDQHRSELEARQAAQNEADVAARGRRRAVVGPPTITP